MDLFLNRIDGYNNMNLKLRYQMYLYSYAHDYYPPFFFGINNIFVVKHSLNYSTFLL